jgi:Bifunctional DNA primase/polymerase, N-terminal
MARWRPGYVLRDAALAYASRGIPVLPLHHPVAHLQGARPVPAGQPLDTPQWWTACSCGDRACSQFAKHPVGALVPHGVNDATTNRARVLAWWASHPQANIGLATGHTFDVLDVDGPAGTQAIRQLAADHDLHSSGPLVRTGGGGWHYYLRPTGLGNAHPHDLPHVDWRGQGGYVVAPPSRHRSGHPYQWVPGRDLEVPPGEVPAVLLQRLERRPPQRPTTPVVVPVAGDGPEDRYARAALATELARVAAAPVGQRNRQLWESARNLYNLVAAGALDPREVNRGLLAAAERCGLLTQERRQTHRTIASARQVGLAHPRDPPSHRGPEPERTGRTTPQRTPPVSLERR